MLDSLVRTIGEVILVEEVNQLFTVRQVVDAIKVEPVNDYCNTPGVS
jgi:hypothetical protein